MVVARAIVEVEEAATERALVNARPATSNAVTSEEVESALVAAFLMDSAVAEVTANPLKNTLASVTDTVAVPERNNVLAMDRDSCEVEAETTEMTLKKEKPVRRETVALTVRVSDLVAAFVTEATPAETTVKALGSALTSVAVAAPERSTCLAVARASVRVEAETTEIALLKASPGIKEAVAAPARVNVLLVVFTMESTVVETTVKVLRKDLTNVMDAVAAPERESCLAVARNSVEVTAETTEMALKKASPAIKDAVTAPARVNALAMDRDSAEDVDETNAKLLVKALKRVTTAGEVRTTPLAMLLARRLVVADVKEKSLATVLGVSKLAIAGAVLVIGLATPREMLEVPGEVVKPSGCVTSLAATKLEAENKLTNLAKLLAIDRTAGTVLVIAFPTAIGWNRTTEAVPIIAFPTAFGWNRTTLDATVIAFGKSVPVTEAPSKAKPRVRQGVVVPAVRLPPSIVPAVGMSAVNKVMVGVNVVSA